MFIIIPILPQAGELVLDHRLSCSHHIIEHHASCMHPSPFGPHSFAARPALHLSISVGQKSRFETIRVCVCVCEKTKWYISPSEI